MHQQHQYLQLEATASAPESINESPAAPKYPTNNRDYCSTNRPLMHARPEGTAIPEASAVTESTETGFTAAATGTVSFGHCVFSERCRGPKSSLT